MALTWKDRIKVASATTGTGTLTLGAEASGYQTFAAGDDGLRFDIVIEDGTAWETARNCLYTHSGTTLTRGTFSASSTGSAISLSGAENVFVDLVAGRLTSDELAIQTYIAGLIVTKNTGGNTLDISAGACYDPSSNKIISYAGTTALSAGSLGASQWNQVYIYDNAGTVTIEVVNNAAPPSTTYAGTARQGGTNSNRRWIGSFLTTSGSAIYVQECREIAQSSMMVFFFSNPGAAPFRILSAGTATSYTQVTAVGCIPRYVATQMLVSIIVSFTSGSNATCSANLSTDGTNPIHKFSQFVATSSDTPQGSNLVLIEQATPSIYYLGSAGSATGPKVWLDVYGYLANR